MIFDAQKMAANEFYSVFIQALIPRPIAWVLSQSKNGILNLAPFSFFNGVAAEPPMLMISVGWKNERTRKDTWVNIEQTSSFVVHIPSQEQAGLVVASSQELAHDDSEVEKFGLTLAPQDGWPLPRVQGCQAAFLCRHHQTIEIGKDRQGLVFGEILQLWIYDPIVKNESSRTLIDVKQFDPLARLGYKYYSGLGPAYSVKRPE